MHRAVPVLEGTSAHVNRRATRARGFRFATAALLVLLLQLLPGLAVAAEPGITATSRDLVTSYTWGYKSGVKQPHGSYKNGRSMHAVVRRSGTSGEQGYPDYLVWYDEHTAQTIVLERAVAYPTTGPNPASHAVFVSDASSSDQGKFWWVMGGRAQSQPFDLVRSLEPFDPLLLELALDNFVTESGSTTPVIAVVGEDGLIAYRWRASTSTSSQIRFRNYLLQSSQLPQLRFERSLGSASASSPYGKMTIEQLWSKWDPRHRKFALTWHWFAEAAANGSAFGSNPFIYTDDNGATWKAANGAVLGLPLNYANAASNPVITPYDHFAHGENSNWAPRDIGFTPEGAPWITLSTGGAQGTSSWRLTFFRWDGSSWQGTAITNTMQGSRDAAACGALRDYLLCVYSELNTQGVVLARVSTDDGITWSPPVAIDNVGRASTGEVQRIGWISYAQPADRYLDNTARFFLTYWRVNGSSSIAYENRVRWLRVQVGPRTDFTGDAVVDAADLAEFEAAHALGDWRADFNDDGVVDESDRNLFASVLASEFPGGVALVPDVVGLSQSAAAAALTNAGLVVGTVTQQASASVPAGDVISQEPSAGSSVASGSAVDLVVSSGAPASAHATVTPTSLDFGNWMRNAVTPGTPVTLTNSGAIPLPISSTGLSGKNPGQFKRTNNCPKTLAVGANCTVTVVFRPTSTGNKTANLVFTLGGGAGNKTVPLTGTGVNYSFTLSPTSLAFGNVQRGVTSPAKTVTVRNTSSVTLPIDTISLGGTNLGQFTVTDNCPSQLSAGASCTVTVRFRPTSTGNKSATLVVAPGNGVAQKSVALTGRGT